MEELSGSVPEHLCDWWEPGLWCLHSAAWWKRHWERSGIVEVEVADHLPDGGQVWLDWQKKVCPENTTEIEALEADAGRYLGYARVIGRRRPEAKLEETIVSIPAHYLQKSLLRVAE